MARRWLIAIGIKPVVSVQRMQKRLLTYIAEGFIRNVMARNGMLVKHDRSAEAYRLFALFSSHLELGAVARLSVIYRERIDTGFLRIIDHPTTASIQNIGNFHGDSFYMLAAAEIILDGPDKTPSSVLWPCFDPASYRAIFTRDAIYVVDWEDWIDRVKHRREYKNMLFLAQHKQFLKNNKFFACREYIWIHQCVIDYI